MFEYNKLSHVQILHVGGLWQTKEGFEPILVTLKIEYHLSWCKGAYTAPQTTYIKGLNSPEMKDSMRN